MEEELMLISHTRERTTLFRLVVTAVIKPVVAAPSQAAEFDIYQGVAHDGFILGSDYHYFAPVRTTFGKLVGHEAAITRKCDARQGGGTVFGKMVWIKEDLHVAILAFLSIEYALVLQPIVLIEISIVAFFKWCGEFFVIPEIFQSLINRFAKWNLR